MTYISTTYISTTSSRTGRYPDDKDPDDKDTHLGNCKFVCWYDKERSFPHRQVEMPFQVEYPSASRKKAWPYKIIEISVETDLEA